MNVNWCLMGLAFALGLAITLAYMIRRVKGQVPVYGSAGGGASGSAAGLSGAKPKVSGAVAAAGAAGGVAAAKLSGGGDEPYGVGSARVAAGAAAPLGWLIKGNEDSMLYHTTESPSYKQTIAEIWFQDEASARRAGFLRWDEGSARTGGGAATFAATEADLPPGPHGPGTAKPNADGSGPAGWAVKGNEDSMLYHSEESPSYKQTIAEVWFRDVASAEAAGFNRWDSGKSQRDK